MGPRSPFLIALLVAAFSALSVILVMSLFPAMHGSFVPRVLLGSVAMAVFMVSGAVTFFAVERFVQARVDLIHRTVHEARSAGAVSGKARKEDLRAVDAEVTAWAGSKRSEVLELRERERFRREFIGNLAHELARPANTNRPSKVKSCNCVFAVSPVTWITSLAGIGNTLIEVLAASAMPTEFVRWRTDLC